jgi:hypothetical protein
MQPLFCELRQTLCHCVQGLSRRQGWILEGEGAIQMQRRLDASRLIVEHGQLLGFRFGHVWAPPLDWLAHIFESRLHVCAHGRFHLAIGFRGGA